MDNEGVYTARKASVSFTYKKINLTVQVRG
jgi:hypothetical protein